MSPNLSLKVVPSSRVGKVILSGYWSKLGAEISLRVRVSSLGGIYSQSSKQLEVLENLFAILSLTCKDLIQVMDRTAIDLD